MKIHSYVAHALLLSCISLTPVIHTEWQENDECQDHRDRAGSVIEVHSVAELKDIIANNERVVVDFYASWCGPCKQMAPEYAKLPGTFRNIVFVKIDVDITGVVSTFGIKSMPTLVCYKNGEKVGSSSGAKSFSQLKTYINGIFNT